MASDSEVPNYGVDHLQSNQDYTDLFPLVRVPLAFLELVNSCLVYIAVCMIGIVLGLHVGLESNPGRVLSNGVEKSAKEMSERILHASR